MRIDRDTYADFLLTDDEYVAQIAGIFASASSGRSWDKYPGPGDKGYDDDFDDDLEDDDWDDDDDDWDDDDDDLEDD